MSETETSLGWRAVGRAAGYVGAAALLLGTILYLLDASNALGVNNYKPTGAPSVQNEANFCGSHPKDVVLVA